MWLVLVVVLDVSLAGSNILLDMKDPRDEELCGSNQVVFVCIRTMGPTIIWDIRNSNNLQLGHFSFNSNFDIIGTVHNYTIALSQVNAKLISGNSTYIKSSLTIEEAEHLNLSTFSCNGNSTVLNIQRSFNRQPQKITLTTLEYFNGVQNFSIMWNTSASTKDDVYILSVYPPPVYGSNATKTLHSSTTTLSLNNSMLYDINITLCSYEAIASQFSIGPRFFDNESITMNIEYSSFTNGTWSAEVTCNDQDKMLNISCINGSWDKNINCYSEMGESSSETSATNKSVDVVPNLISTTPSRMLYRLNLIWIYIFASVAGFVVLMFTLVALIVCIAVILKRKEKKKLSNAENLDDLNDIQDNTYEQLNNHHFTPSRHQFNQFQRKPSESEYSCLNTGLGTQTYLDDYATVYKRSPLETENCKLAEKKYSCLHQQPDSKSVNDEYAVDPKSYSLEEAELCLDNLEGNNITPLKLEHRESVDSMENMKYMDLEVKQSEYTVDPIHIRVDYSNIHRTINSEDECETPPPLPPYKAECQSPVHSTKESNRMYNSEKGKNTIHSRNIQHYPSSPIKERELEVNKVLMLEEIADNSKISDSSVIPEGKKASRETSCHQEAKL